MGWWRWSRWQDGEVAGKETQLFPKTPAPMCCWDGGRQIHRTPPSLDVATPCYQHHGLHTQLINYLNQHTPKLINWILFVAEREMNKNKSTAPSVFCLLLGLLSQSPTVTKRIYVRDVLIDIPKAGQATNEPLVPLEICNLMLDSLSQSTTGHPSAAL